MNKGGDDKSPGGPGLERDEESPDTPDRMTENAPSRPARAVSDGRVRVDQGGPRNPETVETPGSSAG